MTDKILYVRLRMRWQRAFGIVIAISGVIYAGVSILMFIRVEDIAKTLEMAKAVENREFGFASLDEWKTAIRSTSWVYLAIGVAATICGIGITALREWARLSWLAASVIIVTFVLVAVIYDLSDWTRTADLLVFTISSFLLLHRKFPSNDRAM